MVLDPTGKVFSLCQKPEVLVPNVGRGNLIFYQPFKYKGLVPAVKAQGFLSLGWAIKIPALIIIIIIICFLLLKAPKESS